MSIDHPTTVNLLGGGDMFDHLPDMIGGLAMTVSAVAKRAIRAVDIRRRDLHPARVCVAGHYGMGRQLPPGPS